MWWSPASVNMWQSSELQRPAWLRMQRSCSSRFWKMRRSYRVPTMSCEPAAQVCSAEMAAHHRQHIIHITLWSIQTRDAFTELGRGGC